jgi:outer membrane protein assembly factor BamB
MKSLTSSSAGGSRRKRSIVEFVAVAAFVILLVGSFVFSMKLRQVPAISTGANGHRTIAVLSATSPSVYVASGDGTLYRLDANTGTAFWHTQVTDRNLPAAPVVANGVAYFGTLNGTIYALDVSTGHQLWQKQLGGGIIYSPTIDSGVVYVGSANNYISALNAQNGTILWRFNAGVTNETVVPGSVVIANGVMYGTANDQIDHSYLFAVNASTGASLWRVKVVGQLFTNVQVGNGTIYLASSTIDRAGGSSATAGYVYAYDAKTGRQLWRSITLGNAVLSAPTISNNIVYAGSLDSFVYAFNAQTGVQVWRHQLGGPVSATPLVVNGTLFAGVVSNPSALPPTSTNDATTTGGSIVALNASTGSLLWQQTGINNYEGTPLAQYGNLLYAGTKDNEVYALNDANGQISWHYQMSSTVPFNNAPISAAP